MRIISNYAEHHKRTNSHKNVSWTTWFLCYVVYFNGRSIAHQLISCSITQKKHCIKYWSSIASSLFMSTYCLQRLLLSVFFSNGSVRARFIFLAIKKKKSNNVFPYEKKKTISISSAKKGFYFHVGMNTNCTRLFTEFVVSS